jgi:signal transduction histidine kinase
VLHEFIDRISAWAAVSPFRGALVRYGGTVVVMLLAILLSAFIPLRDSAWIVVIIGVLACSWFGGIGPSLLAPLLLVMSVRAIQKERGQLFDFSSKELTDLIVFLMLTAAVGWSGQIRRRAQALVRRQALELQQEAHRKDHFLATLAHELRNSLAPLRTGLEVLQIAEPRSPDKATIRQTHEMLHRQVDCLARLVDDLLDLSRINSGKIELRRERVKLEDLVRDAVDASRPHMSEAGHQFEVTLRNAPVVLDVDRDRLAQVLLNLLNNAAKFTPPGGRILLADARIGDTLEIRVRDSGIGIRPEFLPCVFEMFTQLEDSRPQSQTGLGIGLNLVKTLVEMHGGTVTAHSAGPGCGSEFVVSLPIPAELPALRRDGQHDAVPEQGATHPRRVLVVEQSEDAAPAKRA